MSATPADIAPAVGALSAIPVIGVAAASIAAILSWPSILKSENNDKAKMEIELLEKGEELNTYINQL